MNKKMMLLAFSVVNAALFALPAIASATPAHISATENFTVTPGLTALAVLETTSEKVECTSGVTGTGSWDSTTAGRLSLEFHGCKLSGFTCTTQESEGGTKGSPAGTISTTKLPFHLISLPNSPAVGVLITPEGGHFVSFTCANGLVKRTVTGNGVIGTFLSPGCDAAAQKMATWKLEQGATGVQKHISYTGTTYGLFSNGTPAAQIMESRLDFNNAKSIDCT